MSEADKCKWCETPYGGDRNENGELYCECDGAEIERLRAELAALKEANRWIPVEERLPDKNYADLGDEISVKLSYPYDRVCSMKFRVREDGIHEFYTGGWGVWNNYVTHWRPLPEPPEAE